MRNVLKKGDWVKIEKSLMAGINDLCRQAHLSLWHGNAKAAVWINSVSKEIMNNNFKLLKEALDEHNILDCPSLDKDERNVMQGEKKRKRKR